MSTPTPTPTVPPRTPIGVGRILVSLIVVLGGIVALLFIPAGRLDWVEAWALMVAYAVFLALYAAWGCGETPICCVSAAGRPRMLSRGTR